MKKNEKRKPPNRIAEERRAAGKSQHQLAELLGTHWVTVSKLERGRIKLTTEWMHRIAKVLDLNEADLLPGTKVVAAAMVAGGIGQDGTVRMVPRRYWTRSRLLSTTFDAPGSFWLEIEGGKFEPFLYPGDFIYLIPAPDLSAEILGQVDGRLALVEDKKGLGHLGFLCRGAKAGEWGLTWYGERLLEGRKPKQVSFVHSVIHNLPKMA